MTHDACEHAHGVCQRENTSQRWFPERFVAQQCRECAALKKKMKSPATWLGFREGPAKGFWTSGAGLVNNSICRPCSSFTGRPQPPPCTLLSPEALPSLSGLKQLLSPRLSSSSGLQLTFCSVDSGLGSNQGASEWLLPESPVH